MRTRSSSSPRTRHDLRDDQLRSERDKRFTAERSGEQIQGEELPTEVRRVSDDADVNQSVRASSNRLVVVGRHSRPALKAANSSA